MFRRGAQEALLNGVHLQSRSNLIVLDEALIVQMIPLVGGEVRSA